MVLCCRHVATKGHGGGGGLSILKQECCLQLVPFGYSYKLSVREYCYFCQGKHVIQPIQVFCLMNCPPSPSEVWFPVELASPSDDHVMTICMRPWVIHDDLNDSIDQPKFGMTDANDGE